MTATSAPSGLKLTEEQVETIWKILENKYGLQSNFPWPSVGDLFADWRTLRAACDEKDAQVARLQTLAVGPLSYAAQRARADDAEARLAAMATVTEADVRLAGDVYDRHSCPSDTCAVPPAMRAAIEAFVANKTAGAGQAADPWCWPKPDAQNASWTVAPWFLEAVEQRASELWPDQQFYWEDTQAVLLAAAEFFNGKPLPAAPSLQRQEAGE